MQASEFGNIINEFWKNVNGQGKARHGVIQDKNSVLIDGEIYPYEMAVAINCSPGKRVFCHIEKGRAVVIGA